MTDVLIYCNVDKMQLKPSNHATVGLGFSENIIIKYRDLEISAECNANADEDKGNKDFLRVLDVISAMINWTPTNCTY